LALKSLRLLDSNFARQNSTLEDGTLQWTGQECQKHPSTNTATLSLRKTKSGRNEKTRKCLLHPETPAARIALTMAISVVALPTDLTLDINSDLFSGDKKSAIKEILETRPVHCAA
jgi:hypothetical protein